MYMKNPVNSDCLIKGPRGLIIVNVHILRYYSQIPSVTPIGVTFPLCAGSLANTYRNI